MLEHHASASMASEFRKYGKIFDLNLGTIAYGYAHGYRFVINEADIESPLGNIPVNHRF